MQPKIATARLSIRALVLAASLGAGVASAQTLPETTTTTTTTTEGTTDPAAEGGETLPGSEDPAAEEPAGEAEEQAAPGRPRLITEETSPGKIYWRSGEPVKFRYEIGGGGGKRDLVVKLYKKGDEKPRKRWSRPNIEPHTEHTVKWGGSPGVSGTYKFRVSLEGGRRLDRSDAKGDPSFRSYTHKFPVRGPHSYGDGYGAGRGHKGQDLAADCGTTLVSARAGRVQHKAYQASGAGYYIVIDGKGTNKDYVYMHLQGPADVSQGQSVRTGKVIGKVGTSGSSTGCHLHFELWKGDWYGGGHAMAAVTKYLKKWDRWG